VESGLGDTGVGSGCCEDSMCQDLSPTSPYLLRYNHHMTTLDPIPLNTQWQLNNEAKLFSLVDLSLRNGAAELRRTFDLEPIGDVCLRFYLHIDAAPEGTAVSMNGREVGTIQAGQSFVADVTDNVTLEDNVLLLKVSRGGRFGAVWLGRVPCESL